jgi:transcriptional regulator with XRE-family HTH domain
MGRPETARIVDKHVGGRVRRRRIELGMSLEDMSSLLGVSYQQVQKCESGLNRIGAGRLYQIGSALGVPVTYFFEGLTSSADIGDDSSPSPKVSNVASRNELMAQRETAELVRTYLGIADAETRRRLLALMAALATARSS